MRWLIDLAIAFLVLGLIEALLKPIAKRFVQRRILKVAPLVFAQLDPYLPALLQECNGAQLEQVVRTKLEVVTGESWAGEDLSLFFRCSIRVLLLIMRSLPLRLAEQQPSNPETLPPAPAELSGGPPPVHSAAASHSTVVMAGVDLCADGPPAAQS